MSRITAFSVICKDKPGAHAAKMREEHKAGHFAQMEATIDQFYVAGPLLEKGDVVGSLLVVKAASAEEALTLVQQDPYYAAGVWESIDVSTFVAAAGDWVGGKTW